LFRESDLLVYSLACHVYGVQRPGRSFGCKIIGEI